MKKQNKIGVIGGMGPDASVRLIKIIIDLARKEFGAKENHEFPELILHSIPMEDFVQDTVAGAVAKNKISESVIDMKRFGIGSVGIACNTAHLLFENKIDINGILLISMIDGVMKDAKGKGFERLGLLASPTTINSGLYKRAMEKQSLDLIVPNKKSIELLGKEILNIIAGDFIDSRTVIVNIANELAGRGVDAIILGCTEIPLVFPEDFDMPVINSLETLARSLLKRYYLREERL